MTVTITCHCGGTRIEVPAMPAQMKSCNCSFCNRVGAIWGYFDPAEIKVVSAEHDAVYSASDGMNQHHFCARCGGHTHGDSPDWASIYDYDGKLKPGITNPMPTKRSGGINVRMIPDIDVTTLTVEPIDGRANW